MFKKELATIKNQYKNSIEVVKKLNDIYTEYDYGGSKRANIFYLDIHINENDEHIKQHAFNAVNSLINHNNLQSVIGNFGGWHNKATLEDAYKAIESINTQTFYNAFCYYAPYYSQRNEYKIKIDNSKMSMDCCEIRKDDLRLILNCIWLINGNNNVMDWDLLSKIYKKADDGATFIFCGCKVTNYKNGRLIIVFSDNELFTKFDRRIKKGLKFAQDLYNERNKKEA